MHSVPFHEKQSMSPKNTFSVCPLHRAKMLQPWQLYDSGMCRHPRKEYKQPHTFNWEDAIPKDMGLKIMRKLRRRGIDPKENINGAIIQEIRRLKTISKAGKTIEAHQQAFNSSKISKNKARWKMPCKGIEIRLNNYCERETLHDNIKWCPVFFK